MRPTRMSTFRKSSKVIGGAGGVVISRVLPYGVGLRHPSPRSRRWRESPLPRKGGREVAPASDRGGGIAHLVVVEPGAAAARRGTSSEEGLTERAQRRGQPAAIL